MQCSLRSSIFCLTLALFLLSGCSGGEMRNEQRRNVDARSLLSRLLTEHSQLPLNRIVELEEAKREAFGKVGFLPYYLRFFEYFPESGDPPAMELTVYLLNPGRTPEKMEEWTIQIGDVRIRIPADQVDADALAEERQSFATLGLPRDFSMFCDLTVMIPIALLEEAADDGFVVSFGDRSCRVLLGAKTVAYEGAQVKYLHALLKERLKYLSEGKPAFELHCNLTADLIE